MVVNEIIAVVLGYLLGSIPSAYIAARIANGKDIRRLGGGNVGGLNTIREVGTKAEAAVGIVAGLAAVIGHMWMVFLKFSGGKGMGTTFGALAVLMPIYGYWYGLLIFVVVIIIPFIITRNVALSMGIGILFLPLIVWLTTQAELATILAIILGLLIAAKFLPTASAAWAKSRSKKDFIFDRGQRGNERGRT